MLRGWSVVIAVVLGLVPALPAQADEVRRYEVAAGVAAPEARDFAAGPTVSRPDDTGQTSDGTLDVGGAVFSGLASGGYRATVVDDRAGSAVVAQVCVDQDGDGVCRSGLYGPDTARAMFCGTSAVIFVPAGRNLLVRVHAVGVDVCDGAPVATATSGTITITPA